MFEDSFNAMTGWVAQYPQGQVIEHLMAVHVTQRPDSPRSQNIRVKRKVCVWQSAMQGQIRAESSSYLVAFLGFLAAPRAASRFLASFFSISSLRACSCASRSSFSACGSQQTTQTHNSGTTCRSIQGCNKGERKCGLLTWRRAASASRCSRIRRSRAMSALASSVLPCSCSLR